MAQRAGLHISCSAKNMPDERASRTAAWAVGLHREPIFCTSQWKPADAAGNAAGVVADKKNVMDSSQFNHRHRPTSFLFDDLNAASFRHFFSLRQWERGRELNHQHSGERGQEDSIYRR